MPTAQKTMRTPRTRANAKTQSIESRLERPNGEISRMPCCRRPDGRTGDSLSQDSLVVDLLLESRQNDAWLEDDLLDDILVDALEPVVQALGKRPLLDSPCDGHSKNLTERPEEVRGGDGDGHVLL